MTDMNNGVSPEQTSTPEVTRLNGIDLNPRKRVLDDNQGKKLTEHFHYHPPTKGQVPCYAAINEAARTLADTILRNTPNGPDQTFAIRKVVEAKMTANSAIATNPDVYN